MKSKAICLKMLVLGVALLLVLLPTTEVRAATDESFFAFDAVTGTITGYNIAGGTDVEIPPTIGGVPVTAIGASAFEYMNTITRVVIPEGVTSIGDNAFNGCDLISSITLPSSLKTIGELAFCGCPLDSGVTLPTGLTQLGKGAFSCCIRLSGITIPAGITEIADYTFSGCDFLGLGSVTFLGDVTRIGDYAFRGCHLSSGITLPDSLVSMGEGAFYNCGMLTSIVIPNTVNNIGIKAFESCWSLHSITLPANLTAIGESFFSGCSALKSITLPVGVTSIGSNAFSSSGLEHITLPASVTSIGEDAFSNCGSLTQISIPSGVTSIGNNTFRDCTSLSSITLPSGITSIGDNAFGNCGSLNSITIPDGVTSIGSFAFWQSGLQDITISAGVVSLGGDMFYNCGGLTSVYFLGDAPAVGPSIFGLFNGADAGLKVYYLVGAFGWTNPWQGREAVPLYRLSYNANGGTGTPPDPMMAKSGDMTTIPDGKDYFTRPGYTFSHWNMQAGGGGKTYAVDSVFTFSTHAVLYAQWTAIPYTVSFNSQSGSAVAAQSGLKYNDYAVRPANPTRAGYVFGGWYKEAASTNAWDFATDRVTSDVTLYAKWTATGNTFAIIPRTVRTVSVDDVTDSGTLISGSVSGDGGKVTERGFVYATSPSPVLGGAGVNKVTAGSGTGTFTAPLSSLAPDTVYYVRAYAIGSAGTVYGEVMSFQTDVADGAVPIPQTGDSSSGAISWLLCTLLWSIVVTVLSLKKAHG